MPGDHSESEADAVGGMGSTDDSATGAETDVDAGPEVAAPGEKYCSNCGATIDENASVCPACGVRQSSAQEKFFARTVENPPAAGLLSFVFPGIGNMYLGQWKRGIAIMVGWFGWAFVGFGGLTVFGFILASVINGLIFFLAFGIVVFLELLVRLLAAYDAYNQGKRIVDGAIQA